MQLNFSHLVHSCNGPLSLPLRIFGCYKLKKEKCTQPLLWALEAGCTAVDTAFVYNNEVEVGKALGRTSFSFSTE